MEQLVQILVQYGDLGMFAAAFLAGSFFPFSSEVVMLGLLAAGTDADSLLMWGTAGNTIGSLFNYGVGSLGRDEWITRFAKVTPESWNGASNGCAATARGRDCWPGFRC